MSCDLVKFIIDALVHGLRENSFSESQIEQVERQICPKVEAKTLHHFGGERVYIPKHDENLRALIAEKFNGRNTAKIAQELRVSRSTIYRALRARKGRGKV